MNSVLAAYPTYQIVTWSGLSADFPEIEKAWDRHQLSRSALVDFNARHVDLYQQTVRGVRLPIPELGLKAVSEHFKFKRKVPGISDGLHALMMYMSYLSTKELVHDMVSHAPISIKLTWEALHRGANLTLEESARLGADYFGLVASSEDFREGTRAFVQKTKPSFRGR